MSRLADLDTIPWVARIPSDALGACEQAQVLDDVRREARIATNEAATLLGIDAESAACLRLVWRASKPLQALIRAGGIPVYPAGLLAKLETVAGAEALTLARGYIKGGVSGRALEDRLQQCRRAELAKRRGRSAR